MVLPRTFDGILQSPTSPDQLQELDWQGLSYYVPLLCGEDASNDSPSISDAKKKKLHPFWGSVDSIQLQEQKRSFGRSATENIVIKKKDGHMITLSGTGPLTDVFITFPNNQFTTEGAFLYAKAKSGIAPTLDPQSRIPRIKYNFSDGTSKKNEINYKTNTDTMIIASLIEARKAGINPEIGIIRFRGFSNKHSPIKQSDLDGLSKAARSNISGYIQAKIKEVRGPGDYEQEALNIIQEAVDYGKASLQGPNALLSYVANTNGVASNIPQVQSPSMSPSPTQQGAPQPSRVPQPTRRT